MENAVVDSVTTFATTVTEALPLGTIAAVMGVAVGAPLVIFLFRWGAGMVLSRARKGLQGRM